MDSELDQLGERIAEQAAHLDAAIYRLLVDLREFDERGGWAMQGALSCAHWLAWRVGWTLATARDRVRVARKLPEVPAIGDALRRGEISYSKVRAMLRIATAANERLLLDYARFMTASQLEETCRKYALVLRHGQDPHPLGDLQRRYVRRRDTEDGMVKLEAVLHPEEAELVWTMLNHAATQLVRASHASTPDSPGTQASAPVSTAPDVSTETQVPTPALASLVVSAEPQAPTPASASLDDSTEPQAPTPASASLDDSTEPQAPTPACASLDVSAETQGLTPASASPSSDSSSNHGECQGGALLDQLLHEADVLRAAQATPDRHQEHDAAEHPRGSHAGVLHQRADAVRWSFNRADALVAVAQRYLRGDRPERAPIEVTLTIAASSLRSGGLQREGGLHPIEVGELGGSFVSCEAARRLSCDSGVVDVVEDDNGVPLSVGRKRRTISGPLKRALRERDKTCTYPGCTNYLFLEAHHVKHWADGGETSLRNACLLCTTHHHYVHEYGYVIELDADQRPRFRDPHGRLVVAIPDRPVIARARARILLS